MLPTTDPRDKQRASRYLNSAFGFRTNGQRDKAMAELIHALQIDPLLTKDSSVLTLAADLTGVPGDQALGVLMQRYANRESLEASAPRAAGNELFKALALIAIELLLMFAVLDVLIVVLNAKVNGLTRLGSILAHFSTLRITHAAPIAGLLLAVTLLAAMCMYWVGRAFGGSAVLLHFMRTLLGVQVVTYVLITFTLAVTPIIEFYGSDDPSLAYIQFNPSLVGFSVISNFFWQSYFVARAHKTDWARALVIIFVSTIAAAAAGSRIGLWQRLGFG